MMIQKISDWDNSIDMISLVAISAIAYVYLLFVFKRKIRTDQF
jgi:hypothetical protein